METSFGQTVVRESSPGRRELKFCAGKFELSAEFLGCFLVARLVLKFDW